MSLFTALILPHLEREFVNIEPIVAQFLLDQLKRSAADAIAWAETKMHADLNGDGKIGQEE